MRNHLMNSVEMGKMDYFPELDKKNFSSRSTSL